MDKYSKALNGIARWFVGGFMMLVGLGVFGVAIWLMTYLHHVGCFVMWVALFGGGFLIHYGAGRAIFKVEYKDAGYVYDGKTVWEPVITKDLLKRRMWACFIEAGLQTVLTIYVIICLIMLGSFAGNGAIYALVLVASIITAIIFFLIGGKTKVGLYGEGKKNINLQNGEGKTKKNSNLQNILKNSANITVGDTKVDLIREVELDGGSALEGIAVLGNIVVRVMFRENLFEGNAIKSSSLMALNNAFDNIDMVYEGVLDASARTLAEKEEEKNLKEVKDSLDSKSIIITHFDKACVVASLKDMDMPYKVYSNGEVKVYE